MKITKLHIQNYKSIQDLVLENPNPFSVFVGPNGAGKSNIFEALEFLISSENSKNVFDTIRLFGGQDNILSKQSLKQSQSIGLIVDGNINVNRSWSSITVAAGATYYSSAHLLEENKYTDEQKKIYDIITRNFCRIFLNNASVKKVNSDDDSRLNSDASNLEKVLSRILKDEIKRTEIIEWMQVLVPEFKDIQIETSSLSGDVNYVVFEKHTNKPFPKHLLSDGTKNILALLTAVYQSDEPQFLCIEEPENGLHPHAIEDLVGLFRNACKEKGHYIWLNTHSQTLVRQLSVDEIIVVDKKEGATRVKQFQGRDLHGLKMDEAWLTNALGGGLP